MSDERSERPSAASNAEQDKRCGTCHHFDPDIIVRPGVWMGWCECGQYPACFNPVAKDDVLSTSGEGCPMWRKKRQPKEER